MPNLLRLGVRYLNHAGAHIRLRETLLVNAGRVQEGIGGDRVLHPHAPLIEDAHEGLLVLELGGERPDQFYLAVRDGCLPSIMDMIEILRHGTGLKPS